MATQNNSFTVRGRITHIGEEMQRTPSFKVREFAIEIEDERNPQFNQKVLFQLNNQATTQIDNIGIGTEVDVDFNLKGKEYIKKQNGEPTGEIGYFNSLTAWRVRQVLPAGTGTATQAQSNAAEHTSAMEDVADPDF